MDALEISKAVLAEYDWGGRAAGEIGGDRVTLICDLSKWLIEKVTD
jgi:hypothetical protein